MLNMYTAPYKMDYLSTLASERPKSSIETNIAALKVSKSVVALVSCSGEEQIIQGSGTIIESCDVWNIVLTSANLIRRPTRQTFMVDILIDNLKIFVHLHDGKSYEGEVYAYDFHYNIAAIKFRSETSLTTAILAHLDDSIDVVSTCPSFELRPHAMTSRLTPGDRVVAVGRYFAKPLGLMAAPGEYWLQRTTYDCKELLTVSCVMKKCGDGGPLINHGGEVIGITYYDNNLIPCLPINIAYKWWRHYKKYGKCCRPSLGIEATNFYVTDLYIMEKVIQKFPGLCKGVLVEKVQPGSSAELARICVDDIIVECGGKPIQSFLEFLEMIWDKVGDVVELVVVRVLGTDVSLIHLNMVVAEAALHKLNRWRSGIHRTSLRRSREIQHD